MFENNHLAAGKLSNGNAILTVVIPIRATPTRNISERIPFCLQDKSLNRNKIKFIVVDDGSGESDKLKHQRVCQENDIHYIYLDNSCEEVCISKARNVGSMHATTEYLMFMDVDLYPYDGFYDALLNEIEIQNLSQYCNDFIMIGVIYLTKKEGVEAFFNTKRKKRKNFFIQKLLEADNRKIEKFSTGTSVCIYNRYSYLSHGGYDEEFKNWGYEDLEFNIRKIRSSHKFQLPERFKENYEHFQTISEYVGWKSVYRLYGDITFQKGIVLFHIWHEVNHNSDYFSGTQRNWNLFEKKIAEYAINGKEPEPLPSLNNGSTLVFSKTNPFVYNRKILPQLGVIYYQDEGEFDATSILSYIKSNKIDRVLMFEPYAVPHRLKLYKSLKRHGIDVIKTGRGTLNDSIFYDWNDFDIESSSYNAIYWNHDLQEHEIERVKDYISKERQTSFSLDNQNEVVEENNPKNRLGVPSGNKVLFVPLQNPSDAAIKHFCGPIESYANFIELLKEVTSTLNKQWSMVIKNPSEEKKIFSVNGALYSDESTKDLIAIADAVLLINSDAGLLSMLWGKPVYYCGKIFYGDDHINREVKSSKELISGLYTNFQPDMDTIYRLLYYLLEEFYSFGKFTTEEVILENRDKMTITREIDFYKVRNIDTHKLNYYIENKARISDNSLLFDRYKNIQKPEPQQSDLWQKIKLHIRKIPYVGTGLLYLKRIIP